MDEETAGCWTYEVRPIDKISLVTVTVSEFNDIVLTRCCLVELEGIRLVLPVLRHLSLFIDILRKSTVGPILPYFTFLAILIYSDVFKL